MSTRYAIIAQDGRYLALGHNGYETVALWVPASHSWTWEYMSVAVAIALQLNIADFRVVPVTVKDLTPVNRLTLTDESVSGSVKDLTV